MPEEEKPVANFEAGLQELESVVKQLESGDLPLERALELFEKGMQLGEVHSWLRFEFEYMKIRADAIARIFVDFGWPSAARFELGTLDGMIGCVAADMGVTLLPRAVVERSAMNGSITIHALSPAHARVETVFIHRRAGHQTSALSGFADCLKKDHDVIAA